jgi:archaetidylinositol phosphate synthase
MIALSLSLLVSYVRARAESLGIELKGIGIGERAERLLIIAIIGMIPIVGGMQWAIIVVSVLAGITLIQRITITSKKLQ